MPNEFCDPYAPCDHLDGFVDITRTYHGRPLKRFLDQLPMKGVTLNGAALAPYVRTSFRQEWKAMEACYGPVNEIVTLAPGEVLKKTFRSFQQHDFTRLVQDAFETSSVTARTDFIEAGNDQPAILDFVSFVHSWGSFFETLGTIAGAVVGGPLGAVVGNWVGDAVDGLLGGGANDESAGSTGTMRELEAVIDRVDSKQRRHLTETIDSRTQITERISERTIPNPYRDRTLQLRMMPTFRRYEVTTTWIRFEWGAVLDVGNLRFPKSGNGILFGDFLQAKLLDPRVGAVAQTELGIDDDLVAGASREAVGEHLNANSEVYSKRLLTHLEKRGDQQTLRQPVQAAIDQIGNSARDSRHFSRALAWSKAHVRNKSVYVPMAETQNALKALQLGRSQRQRLLAQLNKMKLPQISVVTSTKNVHLALGIHIEAAPGDCVLPDVPPAFPAPQPL